MLQQASKTMSRDFCMSLFAEIIKLLSKLALVDDWTRGR
jgi:hypothetical protein